MKKILCTLAVVVLVCVLASCNLQIGTSNEPTVPSIAISEDGYWIINGEKTNVKAEGEKGEQGAQGIQGEKGDKGDQGIQGEKGENGENGTYTNENPQGLAFYLKDDGTYAVEIGYAKYLSKIEIPATYNGRAVTEVGSFTSSDLKEITIPDSVTSIGKGAFSGCENIESITIPFVGATKDGAENTHFGYIFGALSIADNVNEIPNSLEEVIITGGTAIGEDAFFWCDSIENIVIGDSVTTIGNSAFYNCDELTSVTIPNSVITIGHWAFQECYSLTSVTIGASVASVGMGAFSACPNLTRIVLDDDNATYQSINGNLYSKDGTVLVAYANGKMDENFVIPNFVTTIGDYAFGGRDSLTSVTIGNSVTSIGDSAFAHCGNLTSVTISNSVTSIGDSAFAYCGNLTSVTIPHSVTTIGDSAFHNCINLRSVTIPNSVTTISDSAFGWCFSLADVYYAGSEEEWKAFNVLLYNFDCTIHYNYVPKE